MSDYHYGDLNLDKRLPLLAVRDVPPAPIALLEGSRSEGLATKSQQYNDAAYHSPLLDTGDELGMRLLLNSATADAEDFKLLSLEEVERLKREKALLSSRIDAHLRRLALESKVRDASENLVKLHSQKNKRLSKQADDQLQKAARKVEDIATDLWRLQRRESTIKEQLLEHMAGIMSRNIGSLPSSQPMDVPIEFDEDHLYIDSSELTIGDELDTASSSQRTMSESTMRRESHDVVIVQEKLTDFNDRMQRLLGTQSRISNGAIGSVDLLSQCDTLERNLYDLESNYGQIATQQRSRDGDGAALNKSFIRLLHSEGDGDAPENLSQAEAERRLQKILSEMRKLKYENDESSARATDLEEQHSLAMRQLQSDYEKELDDAHSELDDLRQKSHTSQQEAAARAANEDQVKALEMQHKTQLSGLHDELNSAQESISQLVLGHANLKDEHSRVKDVNQSLEGQLAEYRVRLANKTETHEEETKASRNKISLLESTVARLEAELAVHGERNELSQLELKEIEMDRTTERTSTQKRIDELTSKHSYAAASLSVATQDRDMARSQLEDLRAQMQVKFENLEAAHAVTKAKLAEQQSSSRELVQDADRLARTEVDRLTVQLDTVTEELRKALDERTRQSVLKSDFEQKLAQAHEDIKISNRQNEELMHHLQNAKTAPDESQMMMVQSRCDLLQSELDSMLLEFESMTRTSLDHETERTRLEDRADELFERVIELENQVADQRVNDMGTNTPTDDRPLTPASFDDGTNTASLRKEFRKLVQEMRMQHAKQTRTDYAEIKRLERLLAANNIYQ